MFREFIFDAHSYLPDFSNYFRFEYLNIKWKTEFQFVCILSCLKLLDGILRVKDLICSFEASGPQPLKKINSCQLLRRKRFFQLIMGINFRATKKLIETNLHILLTTIHRIVHQNRENWIFISGEMCSIVESKKKKGVKVALTDRK